MIALVIFMKLPGDLQLWEDVAVALLLNDGELSQSQNCRSANMHIALAYRNTIF